MAASTDDILYCLCQKPYDDSEFMIECDVCNDWFHGDCVGIEEHQAGDIEVYHCPNCQLSHGPLQLKNSSKSKRRRKKSLKRMSSDEFDSSPITKDVKEFVNGLKVKKFSKSSKILRKIRGYELDKEYINKNGFSNPILVENSSGLDIRVPPSTFTVNDVELAVGSMRELDVIDVAKQSDAKMLMREFVDYYNDPNKTKILNVISLEFSKTRLSELVVPPRIVDELSWVSRYWPDHTGETRTYIKPEVQKYCLMSVKDSYTDFHVDFGGTSVWYHVIRGRKIFYLIEPTEKNLSLYEKWASSDTQGSIFFGDQVDNCYAVTLEPGNTFFIPTGWIHGVYTPKDSLVFGGNFLHDYNIGLQLQVYEMENRIGTPMKFQFPNFETLCWFAAKNLMESLNAGVDGGDKLPSQITSGIKALKQYLSSWMQTKDTKHAKKHKDFLPDGIRYARLLKQIDKLLAQNDKKSQCSSNKPVQQSLKTEKKDVKVTEEMQQRQTLLGLKFKFNKIDNSLLNLSTSKAQNEAKTSYTSEPQNEKMAKSSYTSDSENSEEERLKSCYSDNTYYYPPLVDSDDEDSRPKKKQKAADVSTSWTPRSRADISNVNKPHKIRKATVNSHKTLSKDNHVSRKSLSTSGHRHFKRPTNCDSPSTSSSNGVSKPRLKRGMATVKQRLGKLLKIDRYIQSGN